VPSSDGDTHLISFGKLPEILKNLRLQQKVRTTTFKPSLSLTFCNEKRLKLSLVSAKRRYSHNMPSILVTVFVLQFAIHLINTVGAGTVNTLVGSLPAQACLLSAYCASCGIYTTVFPLQLRKPLRISVDYRRIS